MNDTLYEGLNINNKRSTNYKTEKCETELNSELSDHETCGTQVTMRRFNVSVKDHWKIKYGECNAAKEIKEKGWGVIKSALQSIRS